MGTQAITGVEYPPIIDADILGKLLHKTVSSIHADRCRNPHRLPPACTPPGTKKPLWLLSDVLAWLAQHREPSCRPNHHSQVQKEASEPSPRPIYRGASTKVERIRASELGITVKELRSREALGGAQ